ncbi:MULTISPECIES: UDP-4-amino-4,6-dideoxy-N-acetyl-beta-L-altrosamine transaminase [unclassified Desulfovibrio]|uniref:UDP-4-amino-4, 6-dideoxy-N-acetyl-beta-L-altrosamine transaminase n=1 Tax=unclassified Desulfovibrio TaxID=2593640 RepID=UPI000F5E4684|nr:MULTISPECIES: UDP-4-amino-4,6-dideoxy-N-acetyl-beta-L-altrosamine transaminase [unclassified Desulfovibrio]RRD71732.1 UDP-4-amino-4,6-dideoxy-N-acetyl-beta-L-altrosamine transaminase [Desulfovibrio sp. OH1209_COT-279]RRD87945.1 UDP-4-amino-4,6-dideoxy-N-acetyl-beta-L-altrosamine transaminase [Desulfovibrio sp. OH1186_COT-070]
MDDTSFLPYGRQIIDDADIQAVVETLRSDWLTTGPAVERFEADVCAYTGARYGVAVSNGTAALHAAMFALGIGKGDEVIVTPMTFAASANCILYQDGTPVFADVDADTLLLDPAAVKAAITPRTKAIIAVDYAGQPCDWDALRAIADRHHLALVADSCHALGAVYKGRRVGTLADITVFSFHPVKHITTGEGGMAVTADATLAARMRAFRGHGITTTASQREKTGAWFYEMTELGYNYRITDFQCALGSAQLKKLDTWIEKRNHLARRYDVAFAGTAFCPLARHTHVFHAYHLYVVRTPARDEVFKRLRGAGIGANVHYVPIYLHPYYQSLGYNAGLCPIAETAYGQILTLPLWPSMDDEDIRRVCVAAGLSRKNRNPCQEPSLHADEDFYGTGDSHRTSFTSQTNSI